MNHSEEINHFTQFIEPQYKIGLLSFTDPRPEVKLATERESYIKESHNELITNLENKDFDVINPQPKIISKSNGSSLFGITEKEQILDMHLF